MMEYMCELISNLMQSFLMIWFVSNFCGYRHNGFKKILGFSILLITDFIVMQIIDQYIIYDGFWALISVVEFVIYAQFFLKGNLILHIFSPLFAMLQIFVISGIIVLFTSSVARENTTMLLSQFSLLRVIVLLACRLFEFLVYKIILSIEKEYNIKYKEWILFIIISILTWGVIILFNEATLLSPKLTIYSLGVSIIAAILNILMYYFIVRINRESEIEKELALSKMQYENVKNTEQKMRALYENTYSIKHDLEKHCLYIRTMAESGDCCSIVNYTDQILNNQLKTFQKIIFTDNDVFNALINLRLEICNQKNIYLSISVENEAINYIKTEDIAILFGNIIDNAIEAAERTDKKLIMLKVQLQGVYISIYIENSFYGQFDVNLKTKKHDKQLHGIGLKNVRAIVDKYNGMMRCFSEKDMFCCDILLQQNK